MTSIMPSPGRRLPRPVREFLHTESAGGVVLLVGALVALVWANSPWQHAYTTLWETEVSLEVGHLVVAETLRDWVNDGLMALFFFVVGLEIKREMVHGELRSPRTAALPVLAALGGMVVPALIYPAVNAGGPGLRGWGVPMAPTSPLPSAWWPCSVDECRPRWSCSSSRWPWPTTSAPSW